MWRAEIVAGLSPKKSLQVLCTVFHLSPRELKSVRLFELLNFCRFSDSMNQL